MKTIARLLAIGILAAGSAQASPLRRLEEPCPEGRAAFERTVYEKIKRDCAICHAPGGIGPTFVLPQADEAYLRVKNYIDVVDLSRSTILVRAGNNHCGKENCNEASGREMETLLNAWWEGGEKSCERFGKYFSAGIAAPADLPTDHAAWKTLEWDLSSISDDLSGVKFSVEAQKFSVKGPGADGSYRFRKPRVKFAFDPIRVKGLRILINGKFDRLANEYEALDQVTAPQEAAGGGTMVFPVLSTQPQILIEEKGDGDTLSLAFDDVSVASGRPRCRAMKNFKEEVMPQLKAADCRSCHTAKGTRADASATASFSMDLDTGRSAVRPLFAEPLADPIQLCSAFIQRSSLSEPSRSVVVEMPARGKLGHPTVIAEPDPYLNAIRDWLAAEASVAPPSGNGE